MSGCTMPCSRMESASSRSASAEKSLRGCSGHGRMRSSGTRCTRSRVSGAGDRTTGCETGAAGAGAGWVRTGLPPNNAPRPRPKAGFAMRAECRRAGELSMQVTCDTWQVTRFTISHCVRFRVTCHLSLATRLLSCICESQERTHRRPDRVLPRTGTRRALRRLFRLLQPATFLRGARSAGRFVAPGQIRAQRSVLQGADSTGRRICPSAKKSSASRRRAVQARAGESRKISAPARAIGCRRRMQVDPKLARKLGSCAF